MCLVQFRTLEVSDQVRSDQSLSRVRLFATPWIAACQASLSITNCRSSLRLTSIESVMPSSHLILCRPLLLLTPIPPSIRVFSNESTLHMRWPKYWIFSFSIIPSKEIPGLISFMVQISVYHFNTVRLKNGFIYETETDPRTQNRLWLPRGRWGWEEWVGSMGLVVV